jgi:hypothetical protein
MSSFIRSWMVLIVPLCVTMALAFNHMRIVRNVLSRHHGYRLYPSEICLQHHPTSDERTRATSSDQVSNESVPPFRHGLQIYRNPRDRIPGISYRCGNRIIVWTTGWLAGRSQKLGSGQDRTFTDCFLGLHLPFL